MPHKKKSQQKRRKKNLSEKEVKTNNRGWNEKSENALRKIQNKCIVYEWVYNRGALRLERKGKILGIFNIIILGINASSIIINLPYNNTIVNIISAVILYITTVTVGLSEFLQYKNTADQYKGAAESYYELGNIINRTLIQNIDERPKANHFLDTVDREFRNIFESSPLVSPKLLDNYEKSTGNKVKNFFAEPSRLNDPSELSFSYRSETDEKSESESSSDSGNFITTNFMEMRMQQEVERIHQN